MANHVDLCHTVLITTAAQSSMGMASDASKVFKGKNLPGQTGGTQITIKT